MSRRVPITLIVSFFVFSHFPVVVSASAQARIVFPENRKIVGIEFFFSGHHYVLSHPNALWMFQRALSENWTASEKKGAKGDAMTLGAFLVVRYLENGTAQDTSLAVEMRSDKGAFRPTAFGGVPCRLDCLLARLLFAVVADREPRFTKDNPTDISDSAIMGGFTPVELRWIGDKELTERASKELEDEFIRQAIQVGNGTLDDRRNLVSAYMRMATRSADCAEYAKALEYFAQAESVPMPDDAESRTGRPWRLEVQALCEIGRLSRVYVPQHDTAKAIEVLRRLIALRQSEEWRPKAPTPDEQERLEVSNVQALKNLQAKLHELEAEK